MKVRIWGSSGAVTNLDLALLPVWRLHLVADAEGLAVSIGYPGPQGMSNISLANVPFPDYAQSKELATNAARMGLSGKSLSADTRILQEACRGLVNYKGVRPTEVEEIIARAADLLKFTWTIRDALEKTTPGTYEFGAWAVTITS